MNKEIKFRYVYKSKSVDKYEIDYLSIEDIENNKARKTGMFYYLHSRDEYTGLKDSNGKEIYEGDIMPISIGGVPYNHVVEYYPIIAGFVAWQADKKKGCAIIDPDSSIVIGNIYENPELLSGGCNDSNTHN